MTFRMRVRVSTANSFRRTGVGALAAMQSAVDHVDE
jgi:hypothetical protein